MTVALAFICIGGRLAAAAPETELADPSCTTVRRADIVSAARADLVRRARLPAKSGFAKEDSSSASLGLQRDAASGYSHLFLHGSAGQVLRVDSSPSLDPNGWQTMLTLNLLSTGSDWLDASAASAPSRFYRLSELEGNAAFDFADNFLLLDQQGKAHELYYPTNLSAVVVLAAGDSLSGLGAWLTALQPLAQAYAASPVQFWALLSDPTADRTNIAALAQSLGINATILSDPQGLGVRALRLSHAGEIAVVQPPAFTVAYRGQLPDGSGAAGQSNYLTTALNGVIQNQSYAFLRTPLSGPALTASTAGTPNYAQDVAPIFHDHCAICHRPGDVAPFALTNYLVAALWAPSMKDALLSNTMPPWHVDPDYGTFTNSLALPAAAKATLLRWIDAGAPRGDGPDPLADLPPPPSYRAWPPDLGPPDAIVSPGLQQVKAVGTEAYRYIFVQTPNTSNVWLRAAVVLPSAPQVVHHYLVWSGRVGNQGVPGFSTYQSSLAGYVPGEAPYVYPSDSGYYLTNSSWITFNLHYTPNGVATNDTPTLALWYWKSKPPKAFHNDSLNNIFFSIAPGDPESQVVANWTLPSAIRLERLNPHMHLRGKYVRYDVVYPDGTQETLLSVPDYNFKWQTGYQLAQPKILPAGARLMVSGAFDNSPENIYNPDPTARVTWGDQTSSEMFACFFDYVQ